MNTTMLPNSQQDWVRSPASERDQIYSAIVKSLHGSPEPAAVTWLDEIIQYCTMLKAEVSRSSAGNENDRAANRTANRRADKASDNLEQPRRSVDQLLDLLRTDRGTLNKVFLPPNIAVTIAGCFKTHLFETFKKLIGRKSQQKLELAILAYYFYRKWQKWRRRDSSYDKFIVHESADPDNMRTAIKLGCKIERLECLLPGAGFLAVQGGEKFRRFPRKHVPVIVDALLGNEEIMEWTSRLADLGAEIKRRVDCADMASMIQSPTLRTRDRYIFDDPDVFETADQQSDEYGQSVAVPNWRYETCHETNLPSRDHAQTCLEQYNHAFMDIYGTNTEGDHHFLSTDDGGTRVVIAPFVDLDGLSTGDYAFPNSHEMDIPMSVGLRHFPNALPNLM